MHKLMACWLFALASLPALGVAGGRLGQTGQLVVVDRNKTQAGMLAQYLRKNGDPGANARYLQTEKRSQAGKTTTVKVFDSRADTLYKASFQRLTRAEVAQLKQAGSPLVRSLEMKSLKGKNVFLMKKVSAGTLHDP